jgi:hypothetical protein
VKIQRAEVSDGITKRTRQTFVFDGSPTTPADLKAAKEWFDAGLRANGFDGKIAELESWLRTIPRPTSEPPADFSQAWYADAIVTAIGRVRDARARGLTDLALACAVDVGHLWAEMAAKDWPIVKDGRKLPVNRKAGGTTTGAQKRDAAARVREWLEPIAAEAMQHEFANDAARHRWIARRLETSHQITRKPGTIRKILASIEKTAD